MEMVVSIGGNKVKYQGSFQKVMENIVKDGKDKEIKILSVHGHQKELRRLKRELRANNKDVYETAKSLSKWFLVKEYRAINRTLKELKKKEDKGSKKRYEELKEKLNQLEERCKLYK